MANFEKISPSILSSESVDAENFGCTSARGDTFFCTHCFLKYYSFGCKIMILLRHFHIVTIDGGN
jgi:hypothetical protein